MPLDLSPDDQKQAVASIRKFCTAELDTELSDIQALQLLRYVQAELAPSAYNQGVADAQVFMRDRLADLEASCFEGEFAYWPKDASVRRKR